MKKIHGVHYILLQFFKKSLYVLLDEFILLYFVGCHVNCSLFLKNLEKHFCNLTYTKKTWSNTLNIYRKNLLAIFYRLPISL